MSDIILCSTCLEPVMPKTGGWQCINWRCRQYWALNTSPVISVPQLYLTNLYTLKLEGDRHE